MKTVHPRFEIPLLAALLMLMWIGALWRRKAIACAIVLAALGASLVATSVIGNALAAQVSHAGATNDTTDPALFDLPMAQATLDALLLESDQLLTELNQVLDSAKGLTIERDFIELNDQGRNERMQESRTRARNMAINAYIGIGPPLSGVVVLDAESANELSFRNGLLRHQAERLHRAADTYAVLSGEADQAVLELGDSINDEIRRAEALSRALRRTGDEIPYAEWVVSIAKIHDEADQIFDRTKRAEPTAEQWQKLRFCESTETYTIDTGNTFFGAYQFTWETWGTVGGADNPALAPPAEQDARARKLFADRGSQPWPICGRFLP